MKKALWEPGASGDPHRYYNSEGVTFNPDRCGGASALLYEYPLFWMAKGKTVSVWNKDKKTLGQMDTPIRVIYANKGGVPFYCGVVIHEKVQVTNNGVKGSGNFVLCH